MEQEIITLLKKYEDGVPVKVTKETILFVAAAAILTVGVSAVVIKLVKQI